MESRPVQSYFDALAAELAARTPRATIAWALETFGDRLCLMTSMQDAVLLDLTMSVSPSVPVVFLDNGYQFAETLEMVERVESRYGITVEVVQPAGPGPTVVQSPQCCDLKPALLEAALSGRDAWMSGIRRVQTSHRGTTPFVATDKRGLTKISPLAQWNNADVDHYIETNNIIVNPLLDDGFTSIGCKPCTQRPNADDPRSGRWSGSPKTECGLHL